MNDEPLALVERERAGRRADEDGPGGVPVTSYGFEGRGIGHVHHGGANDFLADFRFPREVRDEPIRSGQAIPHPAFPNSRTTTSYRIRGAQDVPEAVELFRMSYARARERAERNPARRG